MVGSHGSIVWMIPDPAPASDLERVATSDGSCTLFSARYNQTYGSSQGALSEAQAVFLENSGVKTRLAARESVRVLEVGFGTGLNFFVTAQACLAQPGAQLHYTALEHTLLDAQTVAPLGYGAHVGDDLLTAYMSWRGNDDKAPGMNVFEVGSVKLELRLGEALTQDLPDARFEAVYHDAFSPEANPELWHEDFLAKLVEALVPGGALVSYCVQGAVRRRLRALGLEVGKLPGPVGGKREVLLAHKPAP